MDSKKKKTTSEYLADFLNFVSSATKDYDYYFDLVNRCDKETQDHLHALEFGESTERPKIATALAKTRKTRREGKDAVTVLEPLVEFYNTNEAVFNQMKQLLGTIRKKEKSLQGRKYYPRVVRQNNGNEDKG